MKFINLKTGVILEPHNDMVIEQMKKSADYKVYEEAKEKKVEETKEETKEGTPKKKKK